jgi:hypothetical protein
MIMSSFFISQGPPLELAIELKPSSKGTVNSARPAYTDSLGLILRYTAFITDYINIFKISCSRILSRAMLNNYKAID